MRGLLRKNGLIGLVEIERHGYFDFFFGMLPGVWTFTDLEDRPDHALMDGATWRAMLTEEGFENVALWSDGSEAASASCSVLLGRNSAEPMAYASREFEHADATNWLIISPTPAHPLAERLAEQVIADGGNAKIVVAAAGSSDDSINPADEAAWVKLCKGLADSAPQHIAFIAPTGGITELPKTDDGWSLVALVKAVNAADWRSAPRINIITQNVLGESNIDLAGGSYWAVGRTIVNEQSNWPCRRIDWDGSDLAMGHLVEFLGTEAGTHTAIAGNVDELRITKAGIFANVIAPIKPVAEPVSADTPFAVTLNAQGSLDNLLLRRTSEPEAPGEGMVEIDLKAAGLNFKDIILALGLLPPELLKDSAVGPLMGLEGAGVVSRVGPGVTTLSVGDHVMLMSEGCFASSITVPEHAAQRLPEGWSFAEGATLPVVGLTVVYALDLVARLQPDETILIHGGAGGVGLMAIQYAKSIGARIIATAGSDEKRDFLRLLGVDCVSDSRTLQFEEDVMTFTDGAGVDVVLNSLAGDAMLASLDVLKPFGRFVEIGKRDFETNSRLNLRALEQNISYFAVDMTFLARQKPQFFAQSWRNLLEACASGVVRPLPLRTYPMSGLRDAFRLMQGGRHVGKLVLNLDAKGASLEPQPKPTLSFANTGIHVIAGGLGGIGLKIGHWMVKRGAKTIALVGRSGVTTTDQADAIAAMEAAGATVVVVQADVSDAEQVTQLVDDLTETYGALRGIIHAVLVLDDRLMVNMDHNAFETVLRPKVLGAYNLHHASSTQPLDYFLTFSSLANLVGNPGQSNYVAANAYLEQLVLARKAAGQPGLALELGAVEDAGILERDAELRASLNKTIGGAIRMADIFVAIDDLLTDGPAVAAVIQSSGKFGGPIMQTARAEALLGQMEAQQDAGADKIDFAQVPVEDRVELMEQVLIQTIAKVMGAKESQIDPDRSLSDSGLDSLMAVEFATTVESRIGVSIPSSELSADRNMQELAVLLLGRLNLEIGSLAENPASQDEDAETKLMLADAELPKGSVFIPAPEVAISERNTVLLTGATGFLGAFLLDAILRKGARHIICLGRGKDRAHAEERLRVSLRRANLLQAEAQVGQIIEVWPSNLAKEGFGLEPAQIKQITASVDLIIHNAADVNFLGGYEDMRAINVQSVHQILDLCREGPPKALHFVSTLRIYACLKQIESSALSEAVAPQMPPSSEGGYVKTKWVADALVRAAQERGLSASVHRPSFVIGRSNDGYSNMSDLASGLFRLAFDTGMLPKLEVSFPVIPVDTAANRIVAFMDTPGEQVGVRHITDWPALTTKDLQSISQKQGRSVDLLPVEDFINKAQAFMQKHPGHPAVWVPSFFIGDAPNNKMGEKLTKPVLPSTELDAAGESQQALARMVHWFQDEFEPGE